MMSMSVVLVCFLVMTEFRLSQANCYGKEYGLKQTAKCAVSEEIMVPFAIKTTTPDQADCKETETVCVKTTRAGSKIRFRGTFPATITSVTVTGTGARAQIPVVQVGEKQSFANPMVGIFPSANALIAADALQFTLKINSPSITEAGLLISGTSGTDCTVGSLCFAVSGQTISLWGTRGAFTSVTVSGSESSKVVIPLIVKGVNEATPNPVVLAVHANGTISSYTDVLVMFDVTAVAGVGGALVEKTTCTGTDSCYEIIRAPNRAHFKGVFPASPMTIALKGNSDQEFVTYYFGHAATLMQNGLLTFAMATIVLYASTI